MGQWVNMFPRFTYALRHSEQPLSTILPWVIRSREETNFTYRLTEKNFQELVCYISELTDKPQEAVQGYIDEARNNRVFADHITQVIGGSTWRYVADCRADFGRRYGWYALTRIMKPRLVVETGVEKGLGSLVICAALSRNNEEGSKGKYIGIDIDSSAGILLTEPYSAFGKIICGDAISTLAGMDAPIDLLISDADHDEEYEALEIEIGCSRLSDNGLIISDNAHAGNTLKKFAEVREMRYRFFSEKPEGHWYPGAGIGAAWCRNVDD